MRVYFEGKIPRQHTPITKRDLQDTERMAPSEVVTWTMTPDEIDEYFKTRHPNMKQPRNSEGKKYHKPIAGFNQIHEKKKQKKRKGAM